MSENETYRSTDANPYETPQTAQAIEHAYSSGRPFWIVECGACAIVLNSGHHYTDRERANIAAACHNNHIHQGQRAQG